MRVGERKRRREEERGGREEGGGRKRGRRREEVRGGGGGKRGKRRKTKTPHCPTKLLPKVEEPGAEGNEWSGVVLLCCRGDGVVYTQN